MVGCIGKVANAGGSAEHGIRCCLPSVVGRPPAPI